MATILKAASIVVAVAMPAIGFFTSLKTDVAVLQYDMSNVKMSVSDSARKIDKLYEAFIMRYPGDTAKADN